LNRSHGKAVTEQILPKVNDWSDAAKTVTISVRVSGSVTVERPDPKSPAAAPQLDAAAGSEFRWWET